MTMAFKCGVQSDLKYDDIIEFVNWSNLVCLLLQYVHLLFTYLHCWLRFQRCTIAHRSPLNSVIVIIF